jgi:hypothetical protein
MVMPAALYAGMVHMIRKNYNEQEHEAKLGQEKTGLRAQL